MTYHHFLFDLDGTLIDSNQHVISCFQHAWQEVRGHTLPVAEITATFGIPLETAIRAKAPTDADALLASYRRASDARGQDDITAVPGAQATLAGLKARGAAVAVVTSKKRVNAYHSLDALGLSPYIDVFIGPEDSAVHKPDPTPVRLALAALQARPETSLMIGDSPHDIEAGRRAGIDTCGVTFAACGPEVIRAARPTRLVDHLSELLQWLRPTPSHR